MSPPRANSAAARDIAYALHPYTDLKAHLETGPVVMRRGEGVRVWDDSGREYIDALAGLWCASLGFSNERLVEAAARQMRTLPFYHSFAAKSHEPMIELAEMLIARAPVPMSKVLFANSGSEANDSAIKMVWYFNNALGRPRKKKIIGAAEGLSRHHRRRRLAHRPARQPPQLRRAAARLRSHDGAAPLPQRRAGRERGGVRGALRGRAGEADPRRRPGDGRRDVGGAGDGRRRRDRAAARLFRGDPAGAEEVRHPAGRRRGDLRVLAHRQLLGHADAGHRSRTSSPAPRRSRPPTCRSAASW